MTYDSICKHVVIEGVWNAVRVTLKSYINLFQVPHMLSCVSPHLFELLKNLFCPVHDTTMEGLHNLQPYPVLRMKCSMSRDSDISHERIALDGDFLRYLHRIMFFCTSTVQAVWYVQCLLLLVQLSARRSCKLIMHEVNCRNLKTVTLFLVWLYLFNSIIDTLVNVLQNHWFQTNMLSVIFPPSFLLLLVLESRMIHKLLMNWI